MSANTTTTQTHLTRGINIITDNASCIQFRGFYLKPTQVKGIKNMKTLSIITYMLVGLLYLILFAFRKELLNDIKETCKLLFNFKGVGEDDD